MEDKLEWILNKYKQVSYLCTNFLCILFALYCVVLFSALVMLMIIPNLEIGYV